MSEESIAEHNDRQRAGVQRLREATTHPQVCSKYGCAYAARDSGKCAGHEDGGQDR